MTILETSLDVLARPLPDETVGWWLKRNALLNDNEVRLDSRCMDGDGSGVPLSFEKRWAKAKNISLEEASHLIRMRHTLFPLQKLFYLQEDNYHHHRILRMCSSCISSDIASRGFAYARRSHNFPGVLICHVHARNLDEACPHCGLCYNGHSLQELNKCGGYNKYRKLGEANFATVDYRYAKFINKLLNTAVAPPGRKAMYYALYNKYREIDKSDWPVLTWRHVANYTVRAFSDSPFSQALQNLRSNVSVLKLPHMAKLAFALFDKADLYLEALAASAAIHDSDVPEYEYGWEPWANSNWWCSEVVDGVKCWALKPEVLAERL